MSSILSNLKQFNPSYENDDEFPACPKVCDKSSCR